jgi:hypothetical protein
VVQVLNGCKQKCRKSMEAMERIKPKLERIYVEIEQKQKQQTLVQAQQTQQKALQQSRTQSAPATAPALGDATPPIDASYAAEIAALEQRLLKLGARPEDLPRFDVPRAAEIPASTEVPLPPQPTFDASSPASTMTTPTPDVQQSTSVDTSAPVAYPDATSTPTVLGLGVAAATGAMAVNSATSNAPGNVMSMANSVISSAPTMRPSAPPMSQYVGQPLQQYASTMQPAPTHTSYAQQQAAPQMPYWQQPTAPPVSHVQATAPQMQPSASQVPFVQPATTQTPYVHPTAPPMPPTAPLVQPTAPQMQQHTQPTAPSVQQAVPPSTSPYAPSAPYPTQAIAPVTAAAAAAPRQQIVYGQLPPNSNDAAVAPRGPQVCVFEVVMSC